MISRLLNTPCTVTNKSTSGVDGHGNPVPSTSGSTSTVCYLSPVGTSEQTGDRNLNTEDLALFLPTGTVINAQDTVTIEATTYEVVGPARRFRRPFDTVDHHLEVSVRVQS